MARKTKNQEPKESFEFSPDPTPEKMAEIAKIAAASDARVAEALAAREPKKVNVQIGFEIEVTISPDADEYTITKLNELKRAAKDAVENEINDHFNRDIGDPEVDLGVSFGFKIVNRWY